KLLMLIFLFLQYWDIDKPLVGWAKSIFCHCFFDRKIFFIDVPPMSCYNNAIFYRTIETIHRWIGSSKPAELPLKLLTEPYVTVSRHTALVVLPLKYLLCSWENPKFPMREHTWVLFCHALKQMYRSPLAKSIFPL